MCAEMVTKQNNSTKLSDLRIAALKEYFQTKLPGSQVRGFGRTSQQANFKPDDVKKTRIIDPDLLKISATVSHPVSKSEPILDPWRLKLLARYRAVEERHRPLCEQPFPLPSQECQQIFTEKPPPSGEGIDIDHYLWLIKHQICTVINPKQNKNDNIDGQYGVGLDNGVYDLERIKMLKETAGEVFAIAKEIEAHIGKPISYDARIIDDEIKRQILGIKHMRRAVKRADQAKADLPTRHYDRSTGDNLAYGLYGFYTSSIYYGDATGKIYFYRTRDSTLEYLKKLHNYVRIELSLPLIDYTIAKPFCVPYVYNLPENLILEHIEYRYNVGTKPDHIKYGIQEIPLE